MAASVQTRESRRIKRHTVAWRGAISFGVDRKPVPCVIRDISTSGAQLLVAKGQQVPERFLLKVGDSAKMFRSQVVWRDGQSLGVKFVGTYPRWHQG